MIHTAPLNTDHIVESEMITESESYLNEHGYKTDTAGYYTVVNHKPDDENSGYIVKAVETTVVPFKHADVIEDSVRVLICNCSSYRYGKGVEDLEDRDTLEWNSCKHCQAVDPTIRALSDEDQSTL